VSGRRATRSPVGIDPSLKGIRAACRVAQQLGIQVSYLVADGRYLPFRDSIFDQVFSYSVPQHLSKENVRSVLAETHRVLAKFGGAWFNFQTSSGSVAYIISPAEAFAGRGTLKSGTGRFLNSAHVRDHSWTCVS
jgi:ubiquinone/menaquinone biosynthesis C-methylase UbiE